MFSRLNPLQQLLEKFEEACMKRISVVFLFLAVSAIALPASALTVTGTLGTIATLSTTAQDLQTAGTYGAPTNYTLSVQIANTSTGSIGRTISLVATTN